VLEIKNNKLSVHSGVQIMHARRHRAARYYCEIGEREAQCICPFVVNTQSVTTVILINHVLYNRGRGSEMLSSPNI
jgi:DTW domain-containing protein YfiP